MAGVLRTVAACRVKNTCAPERATYSIGLDREGIDLAIDRSIRRSRVRCCRRPGLVLLVVQHRVDHTRRVASPPPSPSPLILPSFSALPSSPFAPFSPLARWPTLTSAPTSLSSLSSLPFSRGQLPRPIASPFPLVQRSCVAARPRRRWKVKG